MADLFPDKHNDPPGDAAFVGWWRQPGGHWREGARSHDYFRCWSRLRRYLALLKLGQVEAVVLEAGREP